MGLRVNSNINSLTALTNLRKNDRAQQASLERLSTGLRINRASDDPSGLVISEKLRAQITSLNQALENTQNNINLINTAEAALAEISDILVDVRSSIVFALNTGFASADQISAEQDKINQSLVAIDRISQSTRFANRGLLNGDSDFIVEKNAPDAFDDLTVRSVRLSPSTSLQSFSVNVSQLAERATLISNFSAGADSVLTQLASGGDASDFVTLRIRGSIGSEDIQLGSGATVADLVSAVNQNSAATGVYASTFRPVALDSASGEYVVRGAGAGIQLNGNGQDLIFGVQVGNGQTQTVVVNSGADDVVSVAELEAQLNAVDANFEVYADNGDLYIRNAQASFRFGGAENVRTYTLTANQIATMFNDTEGGSAAGTFGDGTAITLDIDGDGASVAAEQFTFANTGGPGADNPTDVAALIAGIRGLAGWGGNVAIHTNSNGDIVVVDTTGTTMGSAGSAVGIQNAAADDDVIAAALNGFQNVSSYTGDISKLGGTGSEILSSDESVSFINFSVPSDFVSVSNELRIATSAVSGGTLDFSVFDVNNVAGVDLTVADGDGDGFITLSDIQTQLDTLANDADGDDEDRVRYQAYFDRINGLTIVDRYGTDFSIREALAPDTDLQAVFGRTNYASTNNFERIAFYSTEFGSAQVVSIEDVTSPTSDVTMLNGVGGGLQLTADGRDGLGVLQGTSSTLTDLAGHKVEGAGSDVKGTINGLAFNGDGFDVSFVTTSLDVNFTLGEHFGLNGSAGSRADAASFGFAANASIDGTGKVTPQYAGRSLPNNHLESFGFSVRQNFPGGPRNISGMRFQIRETNNAVDSLLLGIQQISTGTLGQDVTLESSDAGSASYNSRYAGGALNTLRSGSGNDLTTNPNNALEIVDKAIDQVTSLRSFLGSVSSDTLQRNLNSVGVAVENLTGAQSFIRDLDFAAETTAFTKSQILFQASTSVLSAANSIPQAVLSLLQGI